MKKLLTILFSVVLVAAVPASAHRLDEYLQATIISIQRDHVDLSMRLVPGVAVSSAVITSIDTNGDGRLSEAEQQRYAVQVLRDLSLSVDGETIVPKLVSADFPSLEEIRQGTGEIHINFIANLPRGSANRTLTYENHHQNQRAAYLVNCLVPSDKNIRITPQSRNENQSIYQLDFVESDSAGGLPSVQPSLLSSLSGFTGAFRLGVHHIAQGTDHLMFLLALLLPAPLLACGYRWGQSATVAGSLSHILGIVTAFTLGHSLTLGLAASGFVHVPSRPIEILIAISILVSAVHAMRPICPRSEAFIALSFGLVHGLAFATALSNLGLSRWYLLVSIFGFNLGIEAMQMIVVAAILPSLLLLSRTSGYSVVRVGGAFLAAVTSVGWIIERFLNVQSAIDPIVERAAHHGLAIAATLLLTSLGCSLLHKSPFSRVRHGGSSTEAPNKDRLPVMASGMICE